MARYSTASKRKSIATHDIFPTTPIFSQNRGIRVASKAKKMPPSPTIGRENIHQIPKPKNPRTATRDKTFHTRPLADAIHTRIRGGRSGK